MARPLLLGGKGTQLGARHLLAVLEALRLARPDVEFEARHTPTPGDSASLLKDAQAGRLDIAVLSAKDLPAELPDGLRLLAVPRRDDPRDALVTLTGGGLHGLRAGARVATKSRRRRAFLAKNRPDLVVCEPAETVEARVRQLLDRDCDGALIAMAALERLTVPRLAIEALPHHQWLPAPGQGALAVVGRDEGPLARVVTALDHAESSMSVAAERAFAGTIRATTSLPMAALAQLAGATLQIEGLVSAPQGEPTLRSTLIGSPDDARGMGARLARALLALGASELEGHP